MESEYDLFEKFPDGSSLWRDSVSGLENTRLRLQELTQRSENEFYALNLTTREVLAFDSERDVHGFCAPLRTEDEARARLLRDTIENLLAAAGRTLYKNKLHENLRVKKSGGEMHNQGATTAIDSERRRSERLLLDVALVVRGESEESKPSFQEKTFTISVSAHGMLLVLATKVVLGQTLILKNPQTQDEVVGRVVRFSIPHGGLAQVGIDFAQPAPEFWPVESLPGSRSSLRG